MPKRKAVVESSEDLDLSPPPETLEDAIVDVTGRDTKKRKTATTTRKTAVKSEIKQDDIPTKTPKQGKRTRKVKVEEDKGVADPPTEEASKKRKTKKQDVKEEPEDARAEDVKPGKVVRKRKTKEEKEAGAMPLAARTIGHKLFIGAHVSSAGGVQNATSNATHIGANAFALFLKSQRKWANPPLLPEISTQFHANCKNHSFDQGKHVVPHGSYLVNLAHTDAARTDQAYTSFVDDLKRCESLGIQLYNFHPGVANSTNGDRGKAIAHLASNINRAHKETSTVITLLENMAAGANVLGSTFEDLRDIIALVKEKDRVGVCLDTCHAFAAGYDLRSPAAFQQTMEDFESIVGTKYLKAVHMNDSKAPFASHRDLHANIGTGFLSLRAFHNLVNDERFTGLPLVLETPITVTDEKGEVVKDEKGKEKEDKAIWAGEIKLLENLVGMDVEGQEFREAEQRLARKGEPERKRLEEQIKRKREKDEGKGKKAKVKGKKKRGGEESELSSLESEVGEE